jgi:hypothetical protein
MACSVCGPVVELLDAEHALAQELFFDQSETNKARYLEARLRRVTVRWPTLAQCPAPMCREDIAGRMLMIENTIEEVRKDPEFDRRAREIDTRRFGNQGSAS